MPQQQHKGFLVLFTRHKSVMLFRFSDWLSRYRHLKLNKLKILRGAFALRQNQRRADAWRANTLQRNVNAGYISTTARRSTPPWCKRALTLTAGNSKSLANGRSCTGRSSAFCSPAYLACRFAQWRVYHLKKKSINHMTQRHCPAGCWLMSESLFLFKCNR